MDNKAFFKNAERTIKERGLTMAEFYKLAGIHQTTWMRWKGGQAYRSDSATKVNDALKKLSRRKVVAQ